MDIFASNKLKMPKTKLNKLIEAADATAPPEKLKADFSERILSDESFFSQLNTESENTAPEAEPKPPTVEDILRQQKLQEDAKPQPPPNAAAPPPTATATEEKKLSADSQELVAFVIVLIMTVAHSYGIELITKRKGSAKDYQPDKSHLNKFEKELADYLKTRTINVHPAVSLTIAGLAVFCPSLILAYQERTSSERISEPMKPQTGKRGRPRKNA